MKRSKTKTMTMITMTTKTKMKKKLTPVTRSYQNKSRKQLMNLELKRVKKEEIPMKSLWACSKSKVGTF